MTSDSTPVFALEKEALKTEIETGLQVGVDHLEDKPMKRKPVEKYHNTRYLLKQYRKVAYAIQISESDMNVRMEMEHEPGFPHWRSMQSLLGLIYPAQSLKDTHARSYGARICFRSSKTR